jgi:hypothetical protein
MCRAKRAREAVGALCDKLRSLAAKTTIEVRVFLLGTLKHFANRRNGDGQGDGDPGGQGSVRGGVTVAFGP